MSNAFVYIPTVLVHVLLVMVCICGDSLTNNLKKLSLRKGMADNLTHGLIAAISWLLVLLPLKCQFEFWLSPNKLAQVVTCGLVGCLIDVDHFITAKSLSLKVGIPFPYEITLSLWNKIIALFQNALSLTHRPILHCSTIPVSLLVILVLTGKLVCSRHPITAGFMIFTSIFSHHIRDATRRGLWFFPFGSTPPLPYSLYILLELIIPHSVKLYSYKPSISEIGVV